MIVTITTKHMLGNSWSHKANPQKRMCPLYEAMEEAGFKDIFVGGHTAEGVKDGVLYECELFLNNWDMSAAVANIQRVNNEENLSVSLKFKRKI